MIDSSLWNDDIIEIGVCLNPAYSNCILLRANYIVKLFLLVEVSDLESKLKVGARDFIDLSSEIRIRGAE